MGPITLKGRKMVFIPSLVFLIAALVGILMAVIYTAWHQFRLLTITMVSAFLCIFQLLIAVDRAYNDGTGHSHAGLTGTLNTEPWYYFLYLVGAVGFLVAGIGYLVRKSRLRRSQQFSSKVTHLPNKREPNSRSDAR